MGSDIRGRLRELVDSVEKALAASLVDDEGLRIESFQREDSGLDLDRVSAEFRVVMSRSQEAAHELDQGSLSEVTVSTNEWLVLCRIVQASYFLVLVLRRPCIIGKARFYLQRAAFGLKSHL